MTRYFCCLFGLLGVTFIQPFNISAEPTVNAIKVTNHPYKTHLYAIVEDDHIDGDLHRRALCSDDVRLEEAQVLCRQVSWYHVHDFLIEFGALFVENPANEGFMTTPLQCNGSEANLNVCPKRPEMEAHVSCTSGRAAYVDCDRHEHHNLAVTLHQSNQDNSRIGAIKVYDLFEIHLWGLVCNDSSFLGKEMRVACRSISFPNENAVAIDPSTVVNVSTQTRFIMTNFDCTGSETHLYDCPHMDLYWKGQDNLTVCETECSGTIAAVDCTL